MDAVTVLVVLLILPAFTVLLIYAISASCRAKQARAQLAQMLGLTLIEPEKGQLPPDSRLSRRVNRAL